MSFRRRMMMAANSKHWTYQNNAIGTLSGSLELTGVCPFNYSNGCTIFIDGVVYSYKQYSWLFILFSSVSNAYTGLQEIAAEQWRLLGKSNDSNNFTMKFNKRFKAIYRYNPSTDYHYIKIAYSDGTSYEKSRYSGNASASHVDYPLTLAWGADSSHTMTFNDVKVGDFVISDADRDALLTF